MPRLNTPRITSYNVCYTKLLRAVQHLSGKPWFGEWQAETIGSETHFPQRYQVTIRSLKQRANICTCPDFRINQLGTCKHIEAVLHKISKRRDYNKIKELQPPDSRITSYNVCYTKLLRGVIMTV